MSTSVVPFAHPHYVLGRRRYSTNGALFGFALFTKVDGALDPCLEEGAVLFGHLLDELTEHMPVQSGQQMLMMWSVQVWWYADWPLREGVPSEPP